eukprot:COSAG02_NODE_625_length_19372_cov_14.475355_10_plen_363_part_00
MTERVDLPGPTRDGVVAKVLLEELVATGGLVYHLDVVRARLVVHAPRAVDELELPILDERPSHVAAGIVLLVPPAREEPGLDVDEVALWILDELVNDGVHDVVDLGEEVLVHRHLPASVVVSVRDEVHVDLSLGGAVLLVGYGGQSRSQWLRMAGRWAAGLPGCRTAGLPGGWAARRLGAGGLQGCGLLVKTRAHLSCICGRSGRDTVAPPALPWAPTPIGSHRSHRTSTAPPPPPSGTASSCVKQGDQSLRLGRSTGCGNEGGAPRRTRAAGGAIVSYSRTPTRVLLYVYKCACGTRYWYCIRNSIVLSIYVLASRNSWCIQITGNIPPSVHTYSPRIVPPTRESHCSGPARAIAEFLIAG